MALDGRIKSAHGEGGNEVRLIRLPKLIVFVALFLGVAPLFALLLQQGGAIHLDSSILRVLAFTLKQAVLSTLFSVAPGLVIARALARQEFAGRNFLLTIFALPMAVPAIVAVLGVTALIGNAGLSPGLISPYGLSGILIVHVFFNMPMAARLFYQALQGAPQEGYKLSAQLGLSDLATFRHVEWPLLKAVMPQVAAIIFLLCAASFVVVLTLGGASATTLEVAIYQSLRMDFDPPRALALSLIQVALCAALIGFAQAAFKQDAGFSILRNSQRRFVTQTWLARAVDTLMIALGVAIVLPVLAVIVWRGIDSLHFTAPTWQALSTSLALGFASALVALLLAWPMAKAQDATSRLLSLSGLIVPPAVIATGWFLLLHRLGDSIALTSGFIIALNSLIALPYAVAVLRGGQVRLAPLMKLQHQLDITGLNALRIIEWPLLLGATIQAFLMALVLSLGDLTAITLLGSGGILTLPTLLHAEMGHYRGADAEGTALLLLLVCGALSFAAQKLGERDA